MFLTTNPAFLMGALVIIASAMVFVIRYLKPDAAREYDVVFAVMGIIYGLCLFLEGYRLIPLLFFAQVLLVVMAGFFAIETFRLRLQLVTKSRQVQGQPRREGFTRTYKPGSAYETRRARVAGQTQGVRMRSASEASRTFESRDEKRRSTRSRSRPQLVADTSARPRRPSRPAPPDEDVRDVYVEDTWDETEAPNGEGAAPDRRSRYNGGEDRPRRPRSAPRPQQPPRLPDEDEDEQPRPPRRVIQVESVEAVEEEEDNGEQGYVYE